LYAGHVHDDAHAARMRSACDAWRILPDDDDAAAAMIAADGLDILVDLAGHSPGHRLPVFARKPAPVQATWLDYFDTTGVSEIDYLLTDRVHTPEADAGFVSERIVWLPNCRFAYAPVAAPEPSPPPQDRNGYVTFGSFNRHAKATDGVAALWKSVLDAVPGSRLALRASAYRGGGTVAFVRERWARAGLPIDRIDFLPYAPLADAMHSYRDIDVALDTFPYGGGVTTCDALAAGVPVVTLAGDAMVARQGAALLRAAGQPQWIAQTPADYVRLAAAVAGDARRADVRRDLALGLPASPLGRIAAFAAALERALRAMVEAGPRNGEETRAPLVIEP
jgi:predicted O-linked N-acetylglucosamine transferase (SPINDLY family)